MAQNTLLFAYRPFPWKAFIEIHDFNYHRPRTPLKKLIRRLILFFCWLPPAAWIYVDSYVVETNHWGAFAAALFLPPILYMSALMGTAGLILWLWQVVHREWDWLRALASALAGSVAIYATTHR
jgi:hypothetical protein